MTFALIPAGGKSERMGRPKLALPLAGLSILEHVVGAVREAGIADVLVVIGPHVAELVPLAEAAGAHALLLSEATPDMRTTVEQGLLALEDLFHPRPEDSWLLLPADHPTLGPAVIRSLMQAHLDQPKATILIPTYEGHRGHPALLEWRHVAGIRAMPPNQGLNAYFRAHAAETCELPVLDATILRDLDTPEDYERLLKERK